MRAGDLRHLLTLDAPATAADGDGGFSSTWSPLSPSQAWAAIEPATARALERTIASTVQSNATHLITIRYHAGVTTRTRLTKGPRNADGSLRTGSREFQVTGVQNTGERNIAMVLVCQERVS